MHTSVGSYRILRLIDRGGQGSVYLGYDRRLQRRVAIKIYRLPGARQARKALLREARMIAQIQSPKVVKVHDIIESGLYLALILEYVPGCSLEDYLAQVTPSIASVVRVGTDIASALALAQQQRIVHGDIKAANVLIGDNGRVILTDFGIAATAPSARVQQASLSALAPEQIRRHTVDARTDLFALGCLLYRMLTGEHPFYCGARQTSPTALEGPPKPLCDAMPDEVRPPDKLAQLVDSLLQKNPRDRPGSAHHVRSVMRDVLRSLPVSTRSSLLVEARPCFRRESPEDLAVPIPGEMAAPRHPALQDRGLASRVLNRLPVFGRLAKAAAVALPLLLVSMPLVIGYYRQVTPVRFGEPVIDFGTVAGLPNEVSRHWLLRQVKGALDEQLGPTRILGDVGKPLDTTVYARPWVARPWAKLTEVVDMTLRCQQGVCVFAITRQRGLREFHQQTVLLADTPLRHWRYVVRDATHSVLQ